MTTKQIYEQDLKILRHVLDVVSRFYGVGEDAIVGKGRPHDVVEARQMACKLMRDMGLSFARIARVMRGDTKYHTTILHNVAACQEHIETEAWTAEAYNRLMAEIQGSISDTKDTELITK